MPTPSDEIYYIDFEAPTRSAIAIRQDAIECEHTVETLAALVAQLADTVEWLTGQVNVLRAINRLPPVVPETLHGH